MPFVERPYFFPPRNWDLQEWIHDDLGEHKHRVWKNGEPPYPVNIGKQPCGSIDQWANGASVNDAIPLDWIDSKVPSCCPEPPWAAIGGEALGGAEQAMPCGPCAALPLVFTMIMGSNGPPCPAVDGIEVEMHFDDSPCFGGTNYEPFFRSDSVVINGIPGIFIVGCFCSSISPDYAVYFMHPDCGGSFEDLSRFVFDDCVSMSQHVTLGFFLTLFGAPTSTFTMQFRVGA